jgi:DNA-binding MarR family transcriptional regulator
MDFDSKNKPNKSNLIYSYSLITPKELFEGRHLHPTAELIYRILIDWCRRYGFVQREQKSLEERFGMSDATLRKYTNELVDKGLITVIKMGDGKSSVYIINNSDYLEILRKKSPHIFERLIQFLKKVIETEEKEEVRTENSSDLKISEPKAEPKYFRIRHLIYKYINNNINNNINTHSTSVGIVSDSKNEPRTSVCVDASLDQNMNRVEDGGNFEKMIKSRCEQLGKPILPIIKNSGSNYRKYDTACQNNTAENKTEETSSQLAIIDQDFQKIINLFPSATGAKTAKAIFCRMISNGKSLDEFTQQIIAALNQQIEHHKKTKPEDKALRYFRSPKKWFEDEAWNEVKTAAEAKREASRAEREAAEKAKIEKDIEIALAQFRRYQQLPANKKSEAKIKMLDHFLKHCGSDYFVMQRAQDNFDDELLNFLNQDFDSEIRFHFVYFMNTNYPVELTIVRNAV